MWENTTEVESGVFMWDEKYIRGYRCSENGTVHWSYEGRFLHSFRE
jgi:hypothetical protein